MDLELDLIKSLFPHYKISYDKECKVLSVNQPILVEDFIYLKRLLRLSNIDIQDIRISNQRGRYYD